MFNHSNSFPAVWLKKLALRFFGGEAPQNDIVIPSIVRNLKQYFLILAMVSSVANAAETPPVSVTGLTLDGEIEGENIVFTLSFVADVKTSNVTIPVVIGDVAYLDGKLPRGSELVRDGDKYVLKMGSGGGFFGLGSASKSITFRFASRAAKNGEWRSTSFSIPMASVRKLSVICDRDDLEVNFPGALDVKRQKSKEGKTQVTAYLGVAGKFEVGWKPQIRKLESELVVACEANSIAMASVGALRLDSIFTYRIIQGNLNKLSFDLPEINVTQVRGEDIQDWKIEKQGGKTKLLIVLSRPKDGIYRLQVEGEMVLAKFPCKFNLPVITPENVLRTSGFMMMGTDSAIKLQVGKAGGLTQIDQTLFPLVVFEGKGEQKRLRPTRSTFSYQYANMPYTVEVNADDIVTSLTADSQLVLSMVDNELVFNAAVELDVKEALARDILFEMDTNTAWTVTSVTGPQVSEADVDVRDEPAGQGDKKTRRVIFVPFKQAVSGAVLVNVRMERTMPAGSASIVSPRFKVVEARTERGYLVIAAEKGVRLKTTKADGLREVHTGSTQMRVVNAQQAYRFKDSEWKIELGIERTISSIHSEVFHLTSLGEGVMYCSVAISYHIGGAPVQEFKVKVPKEIETVEFTGADIEGWTRDGEICTVRLQARVMGDYTLLVTFDRQFPEQGADISVGGIETIGTDSEVGYIAVASSASIKLTETKALPASTIVVDRGEIPTAYAGPITDPIIKSYKYVRAPHAASLHIEPYSTVRPLEQIADYISVSTRISKDGESVTMATYYIKNASRQFFTLSLPKGVELWSIKYRDENGMRRDVASQKSKNEGKILIPVNRPRNPNDATCIEVEYAQSQGKLGFWKSGIGGLKLLAPALPDTDATFAHWNVTVPEKFAISGAGGNMTASHIDMTGGFIGVLKKTWRLYRAVMDGWGRYTIRRALSGGIGGKSNEEFTSAVNLSSAEPLTLTLQVVPGWMGSANSARGMVMALIFGIIIAAVGSRMRRPVLSAFGLMLLIFAVAQSPVGRSILAVILAITIAVAVISFLCRSKWLRKIGNYIKQKRDERHIKQGHFEEPPPFEEIGDQKPDIKGQEGNVSVRTLLTILAAGLVVSGVMAKSVENEAVPVVKLPPVIEKAVVGSMVVTVEGPKTVKDVEQSASLSAVLEFETRGAVVIPVMSATSVLIDFIAGSRNVEIKSDVQGYSLNVLRKGKYKVTLKYKMPVEQKEGKWSLGIMMPENLQNKVSLKLPEPGLDIQSESAVLFKMQEKKDATLAEAVFGPVPVATFTWFPRIRKTTLEQTVCFSEVNTLATLQSGVVELTNIIRYQIAQGEMREMKVKIPLGMSVTGVQAKGLATWSFDPEKRILDVILEKAISGDFVLTVVTQVACEGLPYDAKIGAIQVQNTSRQRGSMALSAPDDIQVRVDDVKGLNPMNIEDFVAEMGSTQSPEDVQRSVRMSVRRAFRYHQPEDVMVSVHTERVLSEVRVTETGTLSIGDERIMLATKLSLAIAKAGIFSVELGIPKDLDVETLTGPDVSHWDETKSGDHGVIVYFKKQMTETTEINLVIARSEKGIEQKIVVPRVTVKDAAKHNGKLTVSGERGVRIMVDSHNGVDVKKASEEGIRQAGVLVFDILRPTWSIVLKTEVMAAQIKPEVLQWVDLAEGMLQCRAFVQYKIENAGVKSFRLQAPVPGVTLAVSGGNIASVHEVDKEKGIWQVDLHNKVEDKFALIASYQVPYDPAEKKVKILPLQTVDTDGQRGYLVVTCAGRVQVKPEGGQKGLKIEDPRNIPASFGAGDLSSAIQCYRTVRPDYELDLSVVRHDSASVLPANIAQVRMTSVASSGGKLLTRVVLQIVVGNNLRSLNFKLPNKGDALWTVLVDGKEVSTWRDGDFYCIPLEGQEGDRNTAIDLTYAGSFSKRGLFISKQKYEAPRFNLPLNDIEWVFYVQPGRDYFGFGGTMELIEEPTILVKSFNDRYYVEWNKKRQAESKDNALKGLNVGGELMKAGKPKLAQQSFQQALNWSQGEQSLNEDARIQLRNLQKQQWKLGLVNRRDAVRASKNIIDDQQIGQMQGFKGGNYTQEYASDVDKRLSEKDKDALEMVANKLIDQQTAAAGVINAIGVTVPEHGKELRFRRAIQIENQGDLNVTFKVNSGSVVGVWRAVWPAAILFIGLWIFATSRMTHT
ncbi:MAG: hypothetical protein PHR77_14830 [Kiritimatiellae bacterium]|nr:hypothetical protein [Kiritimatiellia bacterium]